MNYYPIFLDLRGRPCLVVGGGKRATRKVKALLNADADVSVISPEVTDAIARYAQRREVACSHGDALIRIPQLIEQRARRNPCGAKARASIVHLTGT